MVASLLFAVPHREPGALFVSQEAGAARALALAPRQSDYSIVYRAPIFTPGHAAVAFAKLPPPPSAIAPVSIPFALRGTAVAQTRSTAIVIWKSGRTQQLVLGDIIGGWTVEKIAVTSLTLTRGGAIMTLDLFPATKTDIPREN
jgi:hypothetical protein